MSDRTAERRDHHGHDNSGHRHFAVSASTDRRWLLAALGVIVAFMIAEVVVGLAVSSLALIADAGHMLTDAAALALAVVASRLAERPARGRYTYGFTRLDAVSAQANGITLALLAVFFTYQAIRRLIHPPEVHGAAVVVVALVGVVVNLVAVYLAGRADRSSLNVRGAIAHVVNDLWAFVATAVAGTVILATGWTRADALASLVVAGLMIYSGTGLIRAAGRVFLEAAPEGLDPQAIGEQMAVVPGVVEVHDLHLWDLGASEPALSAHVVVSPDRDCHQVAGAVRDLLSLRGIRHATLQSDHPQTGALTVEDCCADSGHGPGYLGRVVDDVRAD